VVHNQNKYFELSSRHLHKSLHIEFSFVVGFDDALLCDNATNVAIGCNIKCRIPARHVGGCLGCGDQFCRGSFLDRYALSGLQCDIQRGDGSSNIERDFVEGGNNGKIVGADFVGRVSIGANTICSYNASIDFLGLNSK